MLTLYSTSFIFTLKRPYSLINYLYYPLKYYFYIIYKVGCAILSKYLLYIYLIYTPLIYYIYLLKSRLTTVIYSYKYIYILSIYNKKVGYSIVFIYA